MREGFKLVAVLILGLSTLPAAAEDTPDVEAVCAQGALQLLMATHAAVERGIDSPDKVIERMRAVAVRRGYYFAPLEALVRAAFDQTTPQNVVDELFQVEVGNCVSFSQRSSI
jgi:hypothetical protein